MSEWRLRHQNGNEVPVLLGVSAIHDEQEHLRGYLVNAYDLAYQEQLQLRLQQIAFENKLPVVTLAESGGANLNYAADVFVEGARTFANQARLSAAGIPQITVVHGNATAGGAYQPGLSDYVVLVRNRAKLTDSYAVKVRYGLFFSAYKRDRFYWEAVITARKVCVVALSVFGRTLGPRKQAQIALVVLLVSILAESA